MDVCKFDFLLGQRHGYDRYGPVQRPTGTASVAGIQAADEGSRKTRHSTVSFELKKKKEIHNLIVLFS